MRARQTEAGVALLAVLFALTLLMLLALPFSVSMSAGADAAAREVDVARAEEASASVRDLLLATAALSHPAFDETRDYDGADEWPNEVLVPEAMREIAADGRTTLGGEVVDLQRYIALDSASPLVLANILGTAVRLSEPLPPDATAMAVDDTAALPESGYLWIAHEVLRYGGKDGNRLVDLERGLFKELGYTVPTEPYADRLLVLDYRCVLAAAWPFLGRANSLAERVPYAAVPELAEIGTRGLGSFTQSEIDKFAAVLSVETLAETAATWGRPERVFDDLVAGESRSLRVKSALHVGAGSTVRLRDLSSGAVEYGIVMRATNERSRRDLLLPSVFGLELLLPVSQPFTGGDTVIEPLVPSPVNLNTAEPAVLTALFEDVRREDGIRVHDSDGRQRIAPPAAISRNEARMLADEIVAGRRADGPYTGWKDLVERLFVPRVGEGSREDKMRWVYFYRNLRTGRDAVIEMGTAPITFASGPWVRYRAGASLKRSRVAPAVAARHERSGFAAAVPGFRLEHAWTTQEQFENAFVLDRRSPYWLTTPINLGAPQPGDLGNDPAGRYFPHLVAHAFPSLGLGQPRYASTEELDAGTQPETASAPYTAWAKSLQSGHDTFSQAQSPRGREVTRDGPYLMPNTGPSDRGSAPAASGGGRHDVISFPFSGQFGFMQPFATQFWVEPQTLANVTLFDHGDGNTDRNRFAVLGRDGNLVLELLDEAGLDPNPSDSPSGVKRTAVEIQVPIADIALPADTALHVAASAHSGRLDEVELHVDGVPRGKTRYVTYLSSPLDVFDPTIGNTNQLPPSGGNKRYLDIQVEDTEGFPPVGVLRIGTELFEYTSVNGSSFRCQWNDSIGGRGARQVAREHAPNIPLDQNGRPTIDIKDLLSQGINLNVYPQHPAGARVELYGYSSLLSPDSPMMVGETSLAGSIGDFAVARGYLQNNAQRMSVSPPQGGAPFPVGEGFEPNWTGDLDLADPIQTSDKDPAAAQANILNAFPETGGYAILCQLQVGFQNSLQIGGQTNTMNTGGMEIVRYDSRQGSKLKNVQRAQQIPGDDRTTPTLDYDGAARRFITKWDRGLYWDPVAQIYFHDVTRAILWVIPISLPVQSTSVLWDPQSTQLSEWVQIYPRGGNDFDTEWVRYDAIMGNQHLTRGNRVAWERTRWQVCRSIGIYTINIFQGQQSNGIPNDDGSDPWGTVQATSGYIGYTPQLEATFPAIHAARSQLGFRGDMMNDFYQEGLNRTSAHPHGAGDVVMQCQRVDLRWGNFGAYTGRPGRHDRVALIQGSVASGSQRPTVEWHTVHWAARRFDSDNLSKNATPPERLGPWPFQLVAFKDGVRTPFQGPPSNQQNYQDPRSYDRMVKFPSGELPAAYCQQVSVGAGIGNDSPIQGFIDEVEVTTHSLPPLVVDDAFDSSAKTFQVDISKSYDPTGLISFVADYSADWPQKGGGLVQVDGEILAFSDLTLGRFTIATNGRGLLGTEPRDHDRGAHVVLLTHRPAAILTSQVSARDNLLPVQALGGLPRGGGTLRLGTELLHYTWSRQLGDAGQLEMPRWYPPGEAGTSSLARGLLRARYGTQASVASSGEAVIVWPFRYWDRYAEQSDDPELGYSQLTTTSAPAYFRSVTWSEQIRDGSVDVICRVRADGRAPWSADPETTPGLWEFTRGANDPAPSLLATQASRLEIRFQTVYKGGAVDLVTQRAHGWKTSARVTDVHVDYEGEPRIFNERVTAQ